MFETVLSHSQWSMCLLQSVLQLSDFLLQTSRLFLVIVELRLQVTSPGLGQSEDSIPSNNQSEDSIYLDQPQPLLQLEIDIFLVSRGLTLSVADQKIGLVADLNMDLGGNGLKLHSEDRKATFSLLYLALSALMY